MKTVAEKIETIRQEGYSLDFGSVFNQTFENYKKIALQCGLAILISLVFLGIIGFALLFSLVGFNDFNADMSAFEIKNFTVLETLAYMSGTILFSALACPFTAGLIKMAQDAAKQQEVSLNTAFSFYNHASFKELFFATVIISFFTSALQIGFEFVEFQSVGVIITLCVTFSTFLYIPLISIGKLKAVEAIKGSMIITSKQIFILLGLFIVSILFVSLGFIACCIGVVFTIPFINSLYYCLYNDIIGDEKEDEDETEYYAMTVEE